MIDIEITAAQPHVETIVRLLDPTSIAGIVRTEDGQPVAGARMFAAAEQGADPMWADRPTRIDLYDRAEPLATDEDGAFCFRGLHPSTTYTLTCCPDPTNIGVKIRRTGVEPGRQDVLMVLTANEIRGSSIIGTVVAADSGAPIADFTILRIHHRADGTVRGTSEDNSAVVERGRFTLPGLTLGDTYTFVVRPRDHAPALVGPIDTVRAEHVVDVRVQPFGAITGRVVDDRGVPLVNARVAISARVRLPGSADRVAASTNAEGRLRVSRLSPGVYEIRVLRDGEGRGAKTIEVLAGKTTEVELRVPR